MASPLLVTLLMSAMVGVSVVAACRLEYQHTGRKVFLGLQWLFVLIVAALVVWLLVGMAA